MQRAPRKQFGFTLVELVVVVAIIAIAAAAILSRRNAADQTNKIQAESGNLQAIVGKINSTFGGRPNYAGATTAFILAQGGFPTSMVNGGSVVNLWNGSVTVAPSAANTSVDITYTGVPTSACVEMVSNTSRSYLEVTVNGTPTMAGQPVADLAIVQARCAAADPATIVFNTR